MWCGWYMPAAVYASWLVLLVTCLSTLIVLYLLDNFVDGEVDMVPIASEVYPWNHIPVFLELVGVG